MKNLDSGEHSSYIEWEWSTEPAS